MNRFALPALLVLAGCAAAATTSPPTVPFTALAQPQSHLLAPGACDQGKHVKISKNGGAFKVPPCSGWTGTINYPPPLDHKGFLFSVTSSVTNNFGASPPPSGTPIFYMQTRSTTDRRAPEFAESGVTNTITSPALVSSATYSLYVYNFGIDDQCSSPPCPPWFANIGSPQQGMHSITFASPLNGAAFLGGGFSPIWQFVQN